MKAAERWSIAYCQAALWALNAILAFAMLNLCAAVLLWGGDAILSWPSADQRVMEYRRRFADPQAYKRVPSADVTRLLNEQDRMASLGFSFAPWLLFRNPAFRGELLSTNEDGFRSTRRPKVRAARPTRVYVLGGSTTFGYGVPDDHTIPSYLQEILERRRPEAGFEVSNLGQGYYYSSQELVLLSGKLKEGPIPQVAVFLDGANDTMQLAQRHDEPQFSDRMKELWTAESRGGMGHQVRRLLLQTPAARLLGRMKAFVQKVAMVHARGRESAEDPTDYVIARYEANVRHAEALCGEYRVRCYFVWQPVPFYRYERYLHRKFPYEGEIPLFWGRVYERMRTFRRDSFLYLGDMFEGAREKVFVDDVHYNEPTNEKIAAAIADLILAKGPP